MAIDQCHEQNVLNCLELEEHQSTSTPVVEAKFLDGAAIVQMLDPGTAKSFQEYANEVFIHTYLDSWKQPRELTWCGMCTLKIAGKAPQEKKEVRASEDVLLPLLHFPKSGNIFSV